jgi:hypothetical protein
MHVLLMIGRDGNDDDGDGTAHAIGMQSDWYRIRSYGTDLIVTTVAGGVKAGAADGKGLAAQFQWPYGVAYAHSDSAHNSHWFVADKRNDRVRKLVIAAQ